MANKTISVKDILEYANAQLKRDDEFSTVDFKLGICAMIEKILFMADTYNGYCYLDTKNCEVDSLGYYSRRYFKK